MQSKLYIYIFNPEYSREKYIDSVSAVKFHKQDIALHS